MNLHVIDCEGDNLYPTKLHVLSYINVESKEVCSLTSYDEMREFLLQEDAIFICHNGKMFDIPVFNRILEIDIKARLIDTLALSWYMFPDRNLHGLESWGEDVGVKKPDIEDWSNLPLETYIHRCEEDVKINLEVWERIVTKLSIIYGVDKEEVIDLPILKYLEFKMDAVVLAFQNKWKVDVEHCLKAKETLIKEVERRTEKLKEVMPQVPIYAKRKRPAKPFKKDGSYSAHGENWFALLKKMKLSKDYNGEVKEIVGYKEPNPSSPDQIKSWLYSLGWEPETFKYVKNKETGAERAIPQIKKLHDPELCDSVVKLIEESPTVGELEGLSIAEHRLGLIKGFLENKDERDYLAPEIHGFTNTLRLKHKTIVNLPGVDKSWGDIVRGALIPSEGNILCGADLSSLEDLTKRHYIYPYDPEYVKSMEKPGYDPHTTLAKDNKSMTEDEEKFLKWYSSVNKE